MNNNCKWGFPKGDVQQQKMKDRETMMSLRLLVFANRVDARCLNVRTEIQYSGKTEKKDGEDPCSLKDASERTILSECVKDIIRTPSLKPVCRWYEKNATRRPKEVCMIPMADQSTMAAFGVNGKAWRT